MLVLVVVASFPREQVARPGGDILQEECDELLVSRSRICLHDRGLQATLGPQRVQEGLKANILRVVP